MGRKKHIEVEKVSLKEGDVYLLKTLGGAVLGIGKAIGSVVLGVVGETKDGMKLYKNVDRKREKLHVHEGRDGVINTKEE